MLIKNVWVKFDGIEVECMCEGHKRKCNKQECKEYVVKFIEIERTPGYVAGQLTKQIGKLNTELKRSINKFKV